MESEAPAASNEPTPEKKHIFDDPRNVKRLIWIFFAMCAVLIGLDLVGFFVERFDRHHHLSFAEGEFVTEGWFGFYAIYGFVACVLLVLIAKQMRKLLMPAEDHYER